MKIAEELMALAEGCKALCEKEAFPEISIGLESGNSFLLVSGTKNYLNNLAGLLKFLESKNAKVLAVSLNKPKEDFSGALKKMNAETKNLRIIDGASGGIEPKSLTSIQIALLKELEKGKENAILFDTISFLSIYHSTNELRNFFQGTDSAGEKNQCQINPFPD